MSTFNVNALYSSLTRITDRTTQDVLRQQSDAIASLLAHSGGVNNVLSRLPKPLTLAQIKAALQANGSNPLVITGLPGLTSNVQIGTHAARPSAANNPIGTFYVETDRLSLYVNETVANAPAWVFVTGMMTGTISPDQKPADLTPNDVGFLFDSTDFARVYRWSGTVWLDAPGQPNRGFIEGFVQTPDPIVGWHLCDGTAAVVISKSNGTTTTITVPDYTTESYVKFTKAAATVGPTAPSGTTTDVSAGTPSGTVSQPTFTGSALGTHQHELPMQTVNNTTERFTDPATFGTGTSRAAISTVTTTPDTTSAPVAMSQAVSAGTPAGTVSQPTFTGAAMTVHHHGPGTIELERTVLQAYIRL